MQKRSLISILLLLALCLGLVGCMADIPSSDLPDTTSVHNVLSTAEANAPEETETTLASTETPTEATTEPTTEPVHLHTYLAATCTAPKTCSSCGETTGSSLGHSWKDATCSTPKTCSTCGTTTGLTAGHNFQDGNCSSCGKEDPDYAHEVMVWIPTKGGTKYHSKSSCSKMIDPEYVSLSEAEEQGFTPCKKCYK